MEQIDIITVAFIGLALLAIALGIWAFIAGKRTFEFDNDPIPADDLPGHYEDYETAERPFVNYN